MGSKLTLAPDERPLSLEEADVGALSADEIPVFDMYLAAILGGAAQSQLTYRSCALQALGGIVERRKILALRERCPASEAVGAFVSEVDHAPNDLQRAAMRGKFAESQRVDETSADSLPESRVVNGKARQTIMRNDGKAGWLADDIERLTDPPQRLVLTLNDTTEYWTVGTYRPHCATMNAVELPAWPKKPPAPDDTLTPAIATAMLEAAEGWEICDTTPWPCWGYAENRAVDLFSESVRIKRYGDWHACTSRAEFAQFLQRKGE